MRTGARVRTAGLGILLESIAFLAFTLFTQLPLIYGMAVIGGIGGGLFQIGVAVLMTQYVGQDRVGTGVGVYRTFQDTGSVIGPMLMFFIIENTTMRTAFYTGIFIYGIRARTRPITIFSYVVKDQTLDPAENGYEDRRSAS